MDESLHAELMELWHRANNLGISVGDMEGLSPHDKIRYLKNLLKKVEDKKGDLTQAKKYENTSKYDKAIEIYKGYFMSEDVRRLEKIIQEQEIQVAKNHEIASQYIEAIEIYKMYKMWEDVARVEKLTEEIQREEEQRKQEELKRQDLTQAKNYEIALRYENAIEIYDKYEMWEDAGRCRRLQQQQKSPQTKVEIGAIDQSTKISDSVIQRSSIGRSPRKRIQICPYCGEELNFPDTPRFCPYCRKQIMM